MIQDKGSGQFFAAPGFSVEITKSPLVRDKFLIAPPKIGPGNAPDPANPDYTPGSWNIPVSTAGGSITNLSTQGVLGLTITVDTTLPDGTPNPALGQKLYVFGRFNSESDFEGNYLGEVEIRMDEYTFKPSATSIGVSWSQLTEITLDTSFSISAEETLVSYASQEIRAALDYRAIRLAYAVAKTNAKHNPNYVYHFDAAYNTSAPAGPATGTKEGYIANAQTFVSAIDAVGDVINNKLCHAA